jgi:serine/threonine-protein kinase
MSPEQGMADPNLDGRTDIYSLGCVLYEMLVGQPPFTGRTTQALIARHSLDQVPSLSVVRSTIPEEVEDAVLRSLEKVPADRFSTAAEFAEALQACQTGGTGAVRRTGRRTGTRKRSKKKNLSLVALIATFAVLAISGAAWAGKTFFWDSTRSATNAGVVGFRPQRIAVLYFRDLSPDKKLGYLADGITESLTDQLDQVSALDVISTGGISQFRGKDLPRDSIARDLEAGTLVDGSVAPEGNQVRVTMRLIDGNSGSQFDEASVVESLANPLALQSKLGERLALMLRGWLRDEIRLRTLRAGTQNPIAWSLVQRGEKLRKDADSLGRSGDLVAANSRFLGADSLFAQAESLDPKWVEPIVLRGRIALRQEQVSRDPAEVTRAIDAGIAHANRALAINPRDPDALELRGTLETRPIANGLVNDKRKIDDLLRAAEKDLRAAIVVNPNQAGALSVLSAIAHQQQDQVEAHNLAQRAYEADAYLKAAPEILWRLYATSYDLEQFVNAEKWCDEAARRFPKQLASTRCQLWIMTAKGVRTEPAEAWRRAADYENAAPPQERDFYKREGQIVVAAALGRGGLADSARRVLVRARARDRTIDPSGELVGYEAVVRTMLGDKKEAVDLLQRYLTDHPEHRRGFAKINVWWWRDLQSDPRFQTLVAAGG